MEYPQDIARVTMYKRGLNMHIVQRLGGLPDSRTWNLVTWQKNARTLDSDQSIQYVKKEYRPTPIKGHTPSYHPVKEWIGDPMDIDAR